MASAFELRAEFREDTGKGASRRLRRDGKVPAVIYGGGLDPRAITLSQRELLRQVENEAFFSNVLNIKVGDHEQAAIVKDLQRHPARRQVLHMDFQRVLENEAIRMSVPLHFVGAETSPGVKGQGGAVSHLRTEVEISCLPKHLPEYLDVDLSGIEMDEMVYMSNIVLPEGVEIPELAQGEDFDQPIASCHRPHKIEVEEEVEGEEGEAPVAPEAPPVGDAGEDDTEA